MKKTLLSLGTLTLIVIPALAVISCGSSDKSSDSLAKDTVPKKTDNSYHSKHKDSEYPEISNQMKERLISYASSFKKLKGEEYFKDIPSGTKGYISFGGNVNWTGFNYHELYDYAHIMWNKSHIGGGLSWSQLTTSQKNVLETSNPFPY